MTAVDQGGDTGFVKRTWLRPTLLVPVLAVAFAGAIGLSLIAMIGVSVPNAIAAFIDGTLGSPYALAASLNRSSVFALVGFGFVLANRANLTNVGGEGQIAVGGIMATAVALYGHVEGLPLGLPFILPMIAAVIAGALWGGLAAFLKVKSGTNEVISTLLLSFIGVWLLYWCVQSTALLRKPMTSSATLPESLEIPDETKLPLLTGDYSFPVNIRLRRIARAFPSRGQSSWRSPPLARSAAWLARSCFLASNTRSKTDSPRAMVSTDWSPGCCRAVRCQA
jgi:simple sugar transport system permease protein